MPLWFHAVGLMIGAIMIAIGSMQRRQWPVWLGVVFLVFAFLGAANAT